ncbi:hypothetical protein [Bradyrhizobium elkanii]|uniref:hypothetical protein n=1 Tax=Bradyrhizobium elkanii TaxID=29448 RepID=UPI0021675178|nr:hypothetical protein [Bradyrhizobium elkanii]MCS3521844.1 formamidopyrimidine-DNA glycosylase [Bradyrhizobium elkanii]MCS4069499.1 formamidopyrimidine-DNA glycosylase [Bradyrhizobium elkanii]MCS4076129.1 formamidopyrimidine-DNA glycosylase [Bradyrhizobium elkanii]MDH6687733.1 formamidopyrimidine-DNA glycosylase [Bradyrhizobium elkanii]
MQPGGTGSELLDWIFAAAVLAVVFALILRNRRSIVSSILLVAIIAVGLGVIYAALVLFVTVGVTAYEGYKTKQCQSLHERIEKSRAAPVDYFGEKLRSDLAAEQGSCDEVARRLIEREKADDWEASLVKLIGKITKR